ncbi:MAG: hypothetical protein CMJ75_13390 [Planctomycetaceae bacterium]|nr:hypothetical protein [Planctomycetaceae bacterium]
MKTLCKSCDHVREVVAATGSVFLLCQLSRTQPSFPKYPPQPVVECGGYRDTNSRPQRFQLQTLADTFAICRLAAADPIPAWAEGGVVSITRTAEELSIVCSQQRVPQQVTHEGDWRCLRVVGPLDFSLVGVLSALSGTLAAAGISLFAISTFQTDYLLVRQTDLAAAVTSLAAAGHDVAS